MGWYRIRRKVKGKPDSKIYELKKKELKELNNREKKGEIDLYYVDESGFNLQPYLPDAWQEKGLKIFFFPRYSPELNKIEILWRFIKYKWLEPSAYSSYLNLVKAVEDVLINFGSKYTINFV